MPGTRIDFSNGGTSKGWDGLFTRTEIRGILKAKDYQSFNKVSRYVAALIDWDTECEKTVPMKRVYTHYSEVVADVTGNPVQWAWGDDDLSSL